MFLKKIDNHLDDLFDIWLKMEASEEEWVNFEQKSLRQLNDCIYRTILVLVCFLKVIIKIIANF